MSARRVSRPQDIALPPEFGERVAAEFGEAEAAALLAALERPPVTGLRARSDLGPVSELLQRLGWEGEPLPWSAEGALLPDRERDAGRHPATVHPWQDAGAYYLQDPSAMGVVPVLDPRPGMRVLDLAAAPGGKSTYIADRLAGSGLLWAHDLDAGRVDALIGNLERWGVSNAVVSQGPVERLAPLAGTFDAVLLDAPCSGEGLFRKSAEARRLWSPQRVAEFAAVQVELLDFATSLLRPGGVLVYSTCTFSRAENEEQVAALLARHSELEPSPFSAAGASGYLSVTGSTTPGRGSEPAPGGPAAPADLVGASARWWPHRHAGEGHFVARLRRKEDAPPSRMRHQALAGGQPGGASDPAAAGRDHGARPRQLARRGRDRRADPWNTVTKAEREALSQFVDDLSAGQAELEDDGLELRSSRGQLWLAPRGVDLKGITPRRVGTPLGEVRKGRFEPHHALSRLRRLGAAARSLDLALDDPRLAAYLRGESLSADVDDGWLIVAAAGLPLGWAKAKRGELNNRLPKGLRHAHHD